MSLILKRLETAPACRPECVCAERSTGNADSIIWRIISESTFFPELFKSEYDLDNKGFHLGEDSADIQI